MWVKMSDCQINKNEIALVALKPDGKFKSNEYNVEIVLKNGTKHTVGFCGQEGAFIYFNRICDQLNKPYCSGGK